MDSLSRPVVLLAGKFDIPTEAHVRLVQALQEKLAAEQVICWVRRRTQKSDHFAEPRLPYQHRIHMMNMAMQDVEGVTLCDLTFLSRHALTPEGSENPVALVHAVQDFWPTRQIVVAMGCDRFTKLHMAKGYQELLKRFPVVVWPRGDIRAFQGSEAARFVSAAPPGAVKGVFSLRDFPALQGSSRAAMAMLQGGRRPDYVRADIAAYALQHCRSFF